MPALARELGCLKPVIVDDLIRLGNDGDGGYVLPERALRVADALLSMGVATDWSFEKAVVARHPGLTVHAYDPVTNSDEFRSAAKLSLMRFLLRKATWAEVQSRNALVKSYNEFFRRDPHIVHFYERVYNRLEGPIDATTERVFARLSGKKSIIVKMDIEGGEYRVLDELLAYEQRVPLLIVEFHNTEPLREVFLRKIGALSEYFDVVHVHGNNYIGAARDGLPDTLEITFLNKRMVGAGAQHRDHLPLPGLDFPNHPQKAEHELVFA